MPADYELKATLDDSEVLEALKRIEQKVDSLATETDEQLGGMGEGLGSAADQGTKLAAVMGGVAGVVATATTQVINFAGQIKATLDAVGEAAVASNAQFEVYTTKFKTLLGSAEAAEARIQELAEFGQKTPFELPDIVQANLILQTFGGNALATGEILTRIGDMAAGAGSDFGNLAVWVGRLYSAIQNGQPFGEAAARLSEMAILSGEARSKLEQMQKTGEDSNKIWEYFIENVAGRYKGAMEEQAKTFTGVTSNLADFQGMLIREGGAPFFEEVRQQAVELYEYLDEHADDFIAIAQPIGDIMASIAGFQGDVKLDFIEQVIENKDSIIQTLDTVYDLVAQGKLLLGVFIDWAGVLAGGAGQGISFLNKTMESLPPNIRLAVDIAFPFIGALDLMGEAGENAGGILQWLSDRLAESAAGWEGIFAMMSKATEALQKTLESYQAVWAGDYETANNLVREANQSWEQIWVSGQQAVKKSHDEYVKQREMVNKDISENEDRWKQWMEDRNKKTETGQQQPTEEPTGPSPEDIQAAQDAINKKTQEAEEKHAENLEKIDLESTRRRLDMLEDFAERRADLEQKNLARIEDLYLKFRDSVTDENTGFDIEQQETAIKQAQVRVDFEREAAQRRLDLETNYLRQIRDIRRDFELDAEEYERSRDAVGFLRRQTQRDRTLADAAQNRNDQLTDQRTANERAREEMEIQQQREIEANQRQHQTKLQQLQTRLNRELEANERRYQRELEQQNLYEQRKTADFNKWLTRRLEDEDRTNRQRMEKLRESLQRELALMESYTQQALQLAVQRRQVLDTTLDPIKDQQYSEGRTVLLGGRAGGGDVRAGGAYMVGERGPEVFVPSQSGYIVPNNQLMYSPPAGNGAAGVANSITEILNLELPPDKLTPGQLAETREMVLSIMRELKARRSG